MNPILASALLRAAYSALGEPVGSHRRIFDRTGSSDRPALEAFRLQALRELLQRAASLSPHYRATFDRVGLRPDAIADVGELRRLPVLTREDIRQNQDALRGRPPRLGTATRSTSGSSGAPLILQKSRWTSGAMNALMWRNYAWFGIRMGDRSARIWGGHPTRVGGLKTGLGDVLLNRIRLRSFSLGAQELDDFVRRIQRFRPAYLYGYGQSLYRLAEHLLAAGSSLADVGLKAVISTAEMISDGQRAAMAAAFAAPIVNEYGCTEAGIIAMDCPNGSMHLMDDGLIVEVARDGEPVGPGQEGEILITELFGSTMPLIRYKVGDRGVVSDRRCSCGRSFAILERLSGRVTEMLRCPDGTQVDPYVVEYALKEFPPLYRSVRQWRVVQDGASTIRITLCLSTETTRAEIERLLDQRIASWSRNQLRPVYAYEAWLEPKASGKTR